VRRNETDKGWDGAHERYVAYFHVVGGDRGPEGRVSLCALPCNTLQISPHGKPRKAASKRLISRYAVRFGSGMVLRPFLWHHCNTKSPMPQQREHISGI
jgi:hypothetical protein